MKLRWSSQRAARSLVMTAIGLAVFVVAKWLIEKKPWDSDLVELGLIAVVLFAGNYYREGARDS